VEQNLDSGHGMGVMLQLGPKWLRQYGDIVTPKALEENVFRQLAAFRVSNPNYYPIRLNRIDITHDVRGLRVADFSPEMWCERWVGHAFPRDFYYSPDTRQLEGLSVGSSEGIVRFKVYDKVAESQTRGTSAFWRSVWGVDKGETVDIARFEWSIKAYEGRFIGIRYLSEFTYEDFLQLLNYISFGWGRLCLPDPKHRNQSRRELSPLWVEIRNLMTEWTNGYSASASRSYEFRNDLSPDYVKAVAGWLAGCMARIAVQKKLSRPVNIEDVLELFRAEGLSVSEKSREKLEILLRLMSGDENLW
jgi:hypothetical protein